MNKASKRMYILGVCKHYGLTTHQLDHLFKSLIVSLFTFVVEVWSGASYTKYVSQIDKFINRAYRNNYSSNKSDFKEIILNRDKKLWLKITNDHEITNDQTNALHNLLPNKLILPFKPVFHSFISLPPAKNYYSKIIFLCPFAAK